MVATGGEDDLVSIDKATGIATRVGESDVGTARNGVDFDVNDVLYMVNYYNTSYYTVDILTGLASYLGALYTSYDYLGAHHGDFDPATNLYYGIRGYPGVVRSMLVADLSTGTIVADLPDLADDLHVLTFVGSNDPQTKDDCKKGGWESYSFRNQGQCVRYVETGKDSR